MSATGGQQGEVEDAPGADAEHRARLENLYRSAPVNGLLRSTLRLPEPGRSEIRFEVTEDLFHAAGAAHGTIYFKMLDDAAFYAANSMVPEVFMLTTQFNLFLTRPVTTEWLTAIGQWVSGRRRVLIAESRIIDSEGEEVARGQGTFMRSRISLASLPGYTGPIHGDNAG